YAVLKGLTGNANFTTLPIDLALLKTTLDAYSAAIADARDGSKKAIALRDRLGGDVIRMLKGLALYVELNCKADMNTFLSSGFQPRSSTRTPAQPLDQPLVLYIDQGKSGELLALIKGVRGARTYDVRWGPVGADGATPASWSMKTAAKTKPSISIDGLTPGTTYAIQVRAYGPLGHTEWSDSATRVCLVRAGRCTVAQLSDTGSPPTAGRQSEPVCAGSTDRGRQTGLIRRLAGRTYRRLRIRLQRRCQPEVRGHSALGGDSAPAAGP